MRSVDIALVADARPAESDSCSATCRKNWERIKIQQRLRLGADGDRSETRKNPVAFVLRGHQAGSDAGIAVPRQLVIDKEKCVVAAEQLGNFQRTAESAGGAEMVVGELWVFPDR